MTTDRIQNDATRFKNGKYVLKSGHYNKKGFQLTRHESFLDGTEDMFDILQARDQKAIILGKDAGELIGWQK